MKHLSSMSRCAAIAGLLAAAASVRAQEASERIETPKCSFVCALGGGVPRDATPVTTAAEPARVVSAPGLVRHPHLADSRKTVVAAAPRLRHVAAKATPRRLGPAVAAVPRTVLPPSRPEEPAAIVDLQRTTVVSPVVQIESEHPVEGDAIAPHRVAERPSDDLHLDTGVATGDVEVSGLTRYAPSWDWLITQAHAATARRPDPYGDLVGVRKAF